MKSFNKYGFFFKNMLIRNAFQYRTTQMHVRQQHFTTNIKHTMDLKTKLFLWCGVISSILFVTTFSIEGATRIGYDPLRYPISSLSIGMLGWIQITNFLVTGFFILAFAVGLRRTLRYSIGGVWGPLLIGFVGIGLIGGGIFSTDPVFGYPTNMPLLLKQQSVHGHLHNIFSMLVFIGLPIACFVFCRRFIILRKPGWAAYSMLTAIAMPVTFILAGGGFDQVPELVEVGGALQRVSVIIGWTWMALLSLHLLLTVDK
ncbi:MAG TPA: DUF998 domain-containing protein [Cytophagaceae bacterium]|jgi:hypothetical protein|nr:DUF998 domain-containing protein [Cytophagaceae bacterium]